MAELPVWAKAHQARTHLFSNGQGFLNSDKSFRLIDVAVYTFEECLVLTILSHLMAKCGRRTEGFEVSVVDARIGKML